jgi:hypothetical protein
VLLVIPGTDVLRVFAITGMDHVIPNFTTLPEALARTAPLARQPQAASEMKEMPLPKSSRPNPPLAGELPDTLKRSSYEAQEAFTRALTSAVQAYGEGDQAFRAAYAEYKRTFEKRGDHWIPKQSSSPEG